MPPSNDVVDTLLSSVSLIDLADRLGLSVVQRGGSAKAICPFHDDVAPSLVLYDSPGVEDRSHFHCFACGAHGDIFHLTQKKLSKSFPDAVTWLANQYGIPIPKRRGQKTDSSSSTSTLEIGRRSDGLKRALDVFADHYETETELAKLAVERKFDSNFLTNAEVVIATPGVLKRAALDVNGHRRLLADLEAAELLKARHERDESHSTQSSYHLDLSLWREFFYDLRAVFPIRKESGELAGLAGRALAASSAQAPKYLYSPGFKRAENLYRAEVAFRSLLDLANGLKRSKKNNAPKEALNLYIVEGLFDALRLESLGHPAVSILGSDLSSVQAEMIASLSERLAVDFGVALRCHVFLDRDDAGVRGAAKALQMLLSMNVEADLLWTSGLDGKDPDELLTHSMPEVGLRAFCHPPLLAFLADALGVLPSEILEYSDWEHISPQRFRTAAERILKKISNFSASTDSSARIQTSIDIVSRRTGESPDESNWWLRQFRAFALVSTTANVAVQGLYIEDLFVRLDYARKLAWSSIQRGELPVDELAWRRIDSVSSLFNRGLISRLADANDVPVAPFDTIFVPRSFDQPDHRAKSLPAPEDLILQQYVLAELLSERLGEEFRNCIPAVRFSRRKSETITTGETGDLVHLQTLSFAYQVDTDVLEGWNTPRESGIFRHYWDCWQDFIRALRTRTSGMQDKVHSVRLDLKRYYDNVQRAWVRDILLPSVQRAIRLNGISEQVIHALSLPLDSEPDEIASRIVEWLLKQSFGYQFYEPSTGKVSDSHPNVGLPQGPDLSAYLATVALFPVDRQMRNLLERINGEDDLPRAVYVRYVDDIILAADSETVLNQLRSGLEDALRGTNLQAVNKHGSVRPMSKAEFSASLTEHRAFTASMPAPGFCLSPDGDGAAYFQAGLPENRSDALIVLNDPRLYFASHETVLSGISAALSVHGELRHNEFVKAARWLWYLLSENQHTDVESAKVQFFKLWREAFGYADLWSSIDIQARPWSDPAAYAIEGLDRLLSDKVLNWFRFTENEKEQIGQRLRRLADLVALPDIHHFFESELDDPLAPDGWGEGLQLRLNRMFIQRLSAIRGKAYLLRGKVKLERWRLPDISNEVELRSSLRYVEIGMVESSGQDVISTHGRNGSTATWGNTFSLLHEAIARLRSAEESAQDPIKGLGELIFSAGGDPSELTRNIVEPFLLWFSESGDKTLKNLVTIKDGPSENDEYEVALNSFVAATPANVLGGLLSHRFHLLRQLCQPDQAIVAIPMITGVPKDTDAENPFLYFFCGNAKLIALSHSKVPPHIKFFGHEWHALKNPASDLASWYMEINQLVAPQARTVSPYEIRSSHVRNLGQTARTLIETALAVGGIDENNMKERPISAAHMYKDGGDESEWVIISDPIDSSLLGNKAFLRDGSAGLRTVAVPLEDAWLWRIGVALSDYLGFSDDLDHFAPLPSAGVGKQSELEEPHPAWHIMRESLYRLRGDLSSKRPGTHTGSTLRYVPTGIFRLISQLERFPTDDGEQPLLHQMAFLFAIMAETEAMRLRLSETRNFESPGAVVGFCYQLARNILRFKLKAQWGDWLPDASEQISGKRRPVAGIIALSSRIRQLPKPETNCDSDDLSWDALLAGLELVATSLAIRLTVIDLAVILGDDVVLTDPRHEWCCSGYFVPTKSDFNRDLLDEFRRATFKDLGTTTLEDITPLGWTTLLRAMIEAMSNQMSSQWAAGLLKELPFLSETIDTLVDRMSVQCQAHENEILWPFDAGISTWVATEKECVSISSMVLELTARIDSAFSLRIIEKEGDHFSYRGQQFAGTHHLQKWRLTNWWPDRQRESRRDGERYLYPWTEVWQADRLISVATTSEPLARLARLRNTVTTLGPDIQDSPIQNEPLESANKTNEQVPGLEEQQQPTPKARETNPQYPAPPFQMFQHQAWRERSENEKNSQHVRVALFQWNIDDTYRHPLVDCGVPNFVGTTIDQNLQNKEEFKVFAARRGNEHTFDERSGNGTLIPKNLPSWAEHRRQRLLRSVVIACAQFKVEVLVLPEYSVRPETILALKQLLVEIDGAPAIYAGTYRMFGGSLPGRQSEKLGLIDSKHLDCQSILTLIEPPHQNSSVEISTRSKRYPSAAANEFFNPSSNIRSLFLERAQRGTGFDPLSVFIELVCSELFIATSPSNIFFLANEYQKLMARFGTKRNEEDILKQVNDDVRAYADRTSFGRSRKFWPRRSILVVPAMTSRSADYWLFGQSAMLSSSMTTVFCNAVSGKHGVGGSCFIGRASWHHGDTGACLLTPTPYHGWSHGILYSGPDDPLSNKEQALLIADIDPVHMAEGKPRPQSLSNPLQLVAYLPVIESLDNVADNSPYASSAEVRKITTSMEKNTFAAGNLSGAALHHTTTGLAKDLDALANLCVDGKHFIHRTKVWRNDSNEQPYFGSAPPALVDWLWVDLTPRIVNDEPDIPSLLVPPWTS